MSTIKLDQHYSIVTDSFNVSLVYRREKEVEKNGEKKTVTEKSEYHYPQVNMALKKYLHESLKECDTIEQILQKIEEVEQKIDKIKR